MDQETTAPEGAAFEPRPMTDILRDAPAAPAKEPAGRPEPAAASPEPVETGDKPDAQPAAGRSRDDAGRFAPKADAPDNGPPPEPKQDAPQTVPVAAVLEERKKRQALERQLQELQARITAPPAPQQPPQPAAQPDVPLEDLIFQDPQRFIQAVRAPLEDELVRTRLAMSEANARRESDFDEATNAFAQYVEANPQIKGAIAGQLRSHPDPARWALEQGRALIAQERWGQVIQQYGSPEAYIAAQRPSQPAPVAPPSAPPAPPASLASVRSAGPRGVPTWSGPTPLSSIVGTRR